MFLFYFCNFIFSQKLIMKNELADAKFVSPKFFVSKIVLQNVIAEWLQRGNLDNSYWNKLPEKYGINKSSCWLMVVMYSDTIHLILQA
ncbi:hypothetical protein BpHYR1_038407 [Brachionus plicatilis]|uniref:Uncharacterized protein n=1 Tax=Brachionus plicatilis TaxID=10195 RepID=A0A3M7R4M8_BRAPC|nr:hypothetical protein BpHYR1_038407 [Brachionus plicatilis]